MVADLVMSDAAEDDVSEAYAYYERQRLGLGEDFLEGVDFCIESVLRASKGRSFFHLDYRRALVRKFPYAVFYTFDEDKNQVTVYCIFHASRDPKKLIERLSE